MAVARPPVALRASSLVFPDPLSCGYILRRRGGYSDSNNTGKRNHRRHRDPRMGMTTHHGRSTKMPAARRNASGIINSPCQSPSFSLWPRPRLGHNRSSRCALRQLPDFAADCRRGESATLNLRSATLKCDEYDGTVFTNFGWDISSRSQFGGRANQSTSVKRARQVIRRKP